MYYKETVTNSHWNDQDNTFSKIGFKVTSFLIETFLCDYFKLCWT